MEENVFGGKCMNVELLFKMVKRDKTSRFLVKKQDGVFKSLLINNSENPYVGKVIEVKEDKLCDVDKKWINKYEKFCRSIENIKSHLIFYKRQNTDLKNLPFGSWNGNEYEHILPEEEKELNLIHSYYAESLLDFYNLIKEKNELHRGFANLNSSQAFALNFFVPIIKNEELFADLFELPCFEKIKLAEFEKTLDDKEGSQLDFYLETKASAFTFEVKYSENAFGDAEKDERHEIKYNEVYKGRLSRVIDNLTEEEFFEEYQLWRNICFAGDGKIVCFVFPKFREDLTEKVMAAKDKCKEDVKGQIKILYVDDFVNKVINGDNENMKKHYQEFKRKYLDVKDF